MTRAGQTPATQPNPQKLKKKKGIGRVQTAQRVHRVMKPDSVGFKWVGPGSKDWTAGTLTRPNGPNDTQPKTMSFCTTPSTLLSHSLSLSISLTIDDEKP